MPPASTEFLILVLRAPDEIQTALTALVNNDGWALVGPVQVTHRHPETLYVATLTRKA
jgi:hypothetical protein